MPLIIRTLTVWAIVLLVNFVTHHIGNERDEAYLTRLSDSRAMMHTPIEDEKKVDPHLSACTPLR